VCGTAPRLTTATRDPAAFTQAEKCERRLATSLGFEGHMKWAGAMPSRRRAVLFAPLAVHDSGMANTACSRVLRLGAFALVAAVAGGCGSRADESEPKGFGPAAGATLAVVGIQYDATLPLRSSPGTDQPVKVSLGALADDLVATGRARVLASSIWYEVTAGGVTGWAESRSLAYLGGSYDATAKIVAKLGGPPTAASMLELGRIVATAEVSTEPPRTYRVTVTVAPTL
jgi:hypothetical protein